MVTSLVILGFPGSASQSFGDLPFKKGISHTQWIHGHCLRREKNALNHTPNISQVFGSIGIDFPWFRYHGQCDPLHFQVFLWSSEGTLMQRLPTWAIYNMAPGAQGGMEKGSEPMLGDGQDEIHGTSPLNHGKSPKNHGKCLRETVIFEW
jgi:hypothetical protein